MRQADAEKSSEEAGAQKGRAEEKVAGEAPSRGPGLCQRGRGFMKEEGRLSFERRPLFRGDILRMHSETKSSRVGRKFTRSCLWRSPSKDPRYKIAPYLY